MNNFADFLYALRKEKGMTQAELAELLGITNKAVSKWETGEAMPETSLLLPLSRILGVTVDELLDGKRNIENCEKANNFEQEKADDRNFSELDIENIKKHIFTREKDEEKTLLDIISGIVCSSIFTIGVITYLLLGSIWNLWTPYWIIIPASALSCGIIGIIFDLFNGKKRNKKIQHGENPYIGAICGIIMLASILTYLILGACFSLWHPYWIILVIGSFLCAVIGSVGGIITNYKNQNK